MRQQIAPTWASVPTRNDYNTKKMAAMIQGRLLSLYKECNRLYIRKPIERINKIECQLE